MSTTTVRSRPEPRIAKAYWLSKATAYDCLHDRLRQMLRVLIARRPRSVFDVGCATGEVARAVEQCLPEADYWGCDLSPVAVARLERRQAVVCDLNSEGVPFGGRQFDCIVASGICEYIVDVPAFLGQLTQRLTHGGTLLVSYVNRGYLGRRWRALLRRRPRDNRNWQPMLQLAQFEQALREAGLRIEQRLATHGRITPTDGWRDRYSVARALCVAAPWTADWLAAQMIYVCGRVE